MAIRIIVEEPDPVLREISKPVTEINERIHKLLKDMADTMYDANGVGLAAIQIGYKKRVIIVDIGNGLIEFINPEIIEKNGEQVGPEGCLSIPGKLGEVKRADHIKVKALDRNGKEFVLEANGFLARAIQHEVDHLNGILYTDIAVRMFDPENSN